MHLGAWAIFYGCLTVGVLALSLRTRCPGTRRAAVFLCVMWTLYNLMRPTMPSLDLAETFALLDTLGLMVALCLFGRIGYRRWTPRSQRWISVLLAAFFAQTLAHTWRAFADMQTSYTYYLTLNLLYLVQLGAVASPSLGYWARRWYRYVSAT